MITSYKPEGTYRWFSFKVIQFLWGREETCPSRVHRHQRTSLKLVEYTPYACTLGQGRGAKTPYVPENEAVPPNHTAPSTGHRPWPTEHGQVLTGGRASRTTARLREPNYLTSSTDAACDGGRQAEGLLGRLPATD